MTEFSQIIEDPLFIITGRYIRVLVRHDGDLRRATEILKFAVKVNIYRQDLLEPCVAQLIILKNRVKHGNIPKAGSTELKATRKAWMNVLVKRITKSMK